VAVDDAVGAGLLRFLLLVCGGNLLAGAATAVSLARGVATIEDLERLDARTRAWVLDKLDAKRQDHARLEAEISQIHATLAQRSESAFRQADWLREKETITRIIDRQESSIRQNVADIKRLEEGFIRRHGEPLPTSSRGRG
jgi:hypothetical protein